MTDKLACLLHLSNYSFEKLRVAFSHDFVHQHSFVVFRRVEEEQAVGASYCESLHDLLRLSDFVVIAVKLTPHTTGLIGHRELSLMKPTATLVNISRGENNTSPGLRRSFFKKGHVDNIALFSCLRSSC